MAIRIVSDSTAAIPDALVRELGITIVPAYVLIDDVAHREGVDLTTEEFYPRLLAASRLPTTAQPTPSDFYERIEPLVKAGEQVVCITLSQKLSGTYSSAVQAAGEFDNGVVSVVDSRSVAAGHLLQVIAAGEEARKDDASVDAVRHAATERVGRTHAYFAFDTLEYLQRGGRIGKAQAFMGSLLKVKPVLGSADGELAPIDRPRNMRRAIQRMEELIRQHGPARMMAVGYTTDPEPAEDLRSRVSDLAPAEHIYTARMGPAVGIHGGPGAIGVAILT